MVDGRCAEIRLLDVRTRTCDSSSITDRSVSFSRTSGAPCTATNNPTRSKVPIIFVTLCPLNNIHAVFFMWDTVKFLISLSHKFTSDFDINVPLLSHILYLVFTHTSRILLYILLYCVFLYGHNINSIKLIALNKHIFDVLIKLDSVLMGSLCPTHLRKLISSVPLDSPEF